MAHVRQSRPDSGLGAQVKALEPFSAVPPALGSGWQNREGERERRRVGGETEKEGARVGSEDEQEREVGGEERARERE